MGVVREEIRKETELERKRILEKAKKEALSIISAAQKPQADFTKVDDILDELGLHHLKNG